MRVLFQLNDHKNLVRLAVALSSAVACKSAGHDVALFLAGDGAYVADPETYLGSSSSVSNLTKPMTLARWLIDAGVPLLVSQACAAFRSIEAHGNVVIITFDELARELPAYDHVLVY